MKEKLLKWLTAENPAAVLKRRRFDAALSVFIWAITGYVTFWGGWWFILTAWSVVAMISQATIFFKINQLLKSPFLYLSEVEFACKGRVR